MPRKKKLTSSLENLFPESAGTPPQPESPAPESVPLEAIENAEPAPSETPPPAEAKTPDMSAIPDMAAISEQSRLALQEALAALEDTAGMESTSEASDTFFETDSFEEPLNEIEIPYAREREAISTETVPEAAAELLHLVVLKLADEVYGVDIAAIEQIIELQRITAVPRTLPYIAGLTNLRGTILPVIDLRKRLGLPAQDPTRETRIVVAQIRSIRVGMIVDAVTEVRHVPESCVEPPSPLVTTLDSSYITGIAKLSGENNESNAEPLIILLDLEQILPGVNTL